MIFFNNKVSRPIICRDSFCKYYIPSKQGSLYAYADTIVSEGFCSRTACIYKISDNLVNPPHAPYMINI